jgi:hypothetical protein
MNKYNLFSLERVNLLLIKLIKSSGVSKISSLSNLSALKKSTCFQSSFNFLKKYLIKVVFQTCLAHFRIIIFSSHIQLFISSI